MTTWSLCGHVSPLFIASGLIVLNANDSYYLKPLGSLEPEHHIIYRAEHLPVEGGTCGHSGLLGSSVADIARLVKPVHQRVNLWFPFAVLLNGPYPARCTGGYWQLPTHPYKAGVMMAASCDHATMGCELADTNYGRIQFVLRWESSEGNPRGAGSSAGDSVGGFLPSGLVWRPVT